MNEIYVPYPFEVEPQDTITIEKAQIAQQLITDIEKFCESNLKDSYEVSKIAYAKGIRVEVAAYDDAEKLLEWQVN